MEDQFSGSEVEPKASIFQSKKKIIIFAGIFLFFIFSFPLLFILVSKSSFIKKVPSVEKRIYYAPPGAEIIPERLLIKYRDGYSPQEMGQSQVQALEKRLNALGVISQEKAYKTDSPILKNFYVLKLSKGTDIRKTQDALNKFDEIIYSEQSVVNKTQAVPNDTSYSQLWGMQKINAPTAWDTTTGSKNVLVAVIDTGIDYTHQDIPNDVIKGSNLAYGTSDPMDDNKHGTHVSGTIGAVGNNGIGVAGVNWNVRFIAIKVCNSSGSCDPLAITQGIQEAADRGARVMNISLGGSGTCSLSYQSVIDYAISKGAVIAVAAGNSNSDTSNFTPASCNGVIAVGASTSSDTRASFSNYGARVDIAAPGTQIFSTVLGNSYSSLQGTSMATPHVAGAVALLLSVNSGLTPTQVKTCLQDSADVITTDRPIGKRLNLARMISLCGNGTPPSGTPTSSPTPTSSISPTPPLSNTINGIVCVDANDNQNCDAGESGYVGAAIALSGALTSNTQSNTSGNFAFQNVPVGAYNLVVRVSGQIVANGSFSITTPGTTLTLIVPLLLQLTPVPTGSPTPPPVIIVPTIITPTPTPTSTTTPTSTPTPDNGGGGGGGSITPTPAIPYICQECPAGAPVSSSTIKIGKLCCSPAQ